MIPWGRLQSVYVTFFLKPLRAKSSILSIFINFILSLTLMRYEVSLPLSWGDKKINKPITGSVFLNISFRPIKAEEMKKEGQAYQKVKFPLFFLHLLSIDSKQEVEERATAVKVELVKRAKESGAMFGKILRRIEKERPFACAPVPEGTLNISSNFLSFLPRLIFF